MLSAFVTGGVSGQTLLGNIAINSSPIIPMFSIADYENGTTVTDQTLTVATNAAMNWVLKVRATGNLDRMGVQIPVEGIGIKVMNLPSAFSEVILGTADQDIASGTSLSVMQVTPVDIRYRTTGGNDFLKPAGDYVTNLIFTLTMVNL